MYMYINFYLTEVIKTMDQQAIYSDLIEAKEFLILNIS